MTPQLLDWGVISNIVGSVAAGVKSKKRSFDWAGLATRAMDKGIDIIGNKVQGINTSAGAGGGSLSSFGVSPWASSRTIWFLLIGAGVFGAVLILGGK